MTSNKKKSNIHITNPLCGESTFVWSTDSAHKEPVMWEMYLYHYVIMFTVFH